MTASLKHRLFIFLPFSSLGVCGFFAAVLSLRWPLVGDAALMHYVVFLLERGWRPYKDIVDINFPGAYFFEWVPMRLLGQGAVAWRFYDLSLFLIAAFPLMAITRRTSRLAGAGCALLLLLIHLQDGVAQGGQRDLLIAVLLLCSYAALFHAQANVAPSYFFLCFGLFAGATLTIKPLLAPLCIVLLLFVASRSPRASIGAWRRIGLALTGMLLPSGLALFWLGRKGGVGAFFESTLALDRLHAELGRRPVSYLIAHATSPLAVVCALWLIVLLVHRPKLGIERIELFAGIALTLLAYVLQGKGYPYQRYPFLALLLPVMAMDFVSALRSAKLACQVPALAAIAVVCLILAPRGVWLVRSYRPDTVFRDALEERLRPFGPPLSGNVQCLDTFGGCIGTLYDMRLVPSTGYLYDCYLFTSMPNPATPKYRAAFLAEFERKRPKVVVLTDQFCFGEEGGFNRLKNWPRLNEELSHSYNGGPEWHSEVPQRWWSRSETPASFRVYVRKD